VRSVGCALFPLVRDIYRCRIWLTHHNLVPYLNSLVARTVSHPRHLYAVHLKQRKNQGKIFKKKPLQPELSLSRLPVNCQGRLACIPFRLFFHFLEEPQETWRYMTAYSILPSGIPSICPPLNPNSNRCTCYMTWHKYIGTHPVSYFFLDLSYIVSSTALNAWDYSPV
jgi:hypothetical protein